MAHKVKLPHRRGNRRILNRELVEKGTTPEDAQKRLINCLNLATRMADHAKTRMNQIYSLDKKEWVFCWNLDNMLVDYFGKVDRKMHVRKVYNRMLSASYRLSKGIVIRLRPQEERTGHAKSAGWFAEPKRFKVFTNLLDRTDEEIASVFVHELIHLWFRDQR
ncbi:MAG: hypothetical protein P1U56_25820, partial [Saprospiraceae bacterium]|nr:hypothetical protein [Saprospiraceae bacterium]